MVLFYVFFFFFYQNEHVGNFNSCANNENRICRLTRTLRSAKRNNRVIVSVYVGFPETYNWRNVGLNDLCRHVDEEQKPFSTYDNFRK